MGHKCTNTQIHRYTNTQIQLALFWLLFQKGRVKMYLNFYKYTNTQIHKCTNTQIHKYTNTACTILAAPSIGKSSNLSEFLQSTNAQIHKYANTQMHKYTNKKIHKYSFQYSGCCFNREELKFI